MRRQLTAAALAALLVSAATVVGPAHALAPTPVFAPFLDYPVGHGRAVALGDFTGDGRTDVVVNTHGDFGGLDRVFLLAQGPDGWLNSVDVLEVAGDHLPHSGLAAGDLDGDGATDAVLATGHSLELFFQRSGGLADAQQIALPGVQKVEVADVEGDGRMDLVTSGTSGVAVLRGLGAGSFAPPAAVHPQPQPDFQVADVSGDGRRDIVTCNGFVALVFKQLAGGGFGAPLEYAGDVNCTSVVVADVNGDGRNDMAFVGGGNRPNARLDVFLQTPDGTLPTTPVTYRTKDIPSAVEAGDMNADGRTDLVVTHQAWLTVGIHAQGPDHTLDPERDYRIPYHAGQGPGALAVGDVNGDSRPDMVIADLVNGLVVLWGQVPGPSTTTSSTRLPTTVPTTAPPGPPSPLLSAAQEYDVRAAGESLATGDFNGDGRTDVAMSTGFKFDPDNDYKLFVFYQGADGSMARAVRFDTDGPFDNNPMEVTAGDIDGDGRPDLAVRMRSGIDVFLQRNGTFADRRFLEIGSQDPIEIADIDSDGKGDLLVTGDGVAVHRSLGDGTFAPPVIVRPERTQAVTIVDVTGDGRADLLTREDTFPFQVMVFPGAADGSFGAGVRTSVDGWTPRELVVADFNGDARLDVAAQYALNGGPIGIAAIHILTQGIDGRLHPGAPLPFGDEGVLRAGDVDGDGRTDLTVVRGGSLVAVRLQQADGQFGTERSFPMPYATRYPATAVVLADLTGDRRLDVAVANYNHGLDLARNVAAGVPPATSPPATFHPLPPQRILDTRIGLGAPAARLGPGGTIGVQVTGAGGVPASGVTSVVLNVTVTEPTAASYLTAWPAGDGRPLASNLNFTAGQTVPNLVTVKVGADGRVSLFNAAGSVHVIADVAGWYGPDSPTPGGRYTPVTPSRVLDTRTGNGAPVAKLGPSATLGLQVTGRGGVPESGVAAVVLNVTVTEPTAGSYLTAWPASAARPVASNLNYRAGQTVPNLVIVKVGAGGVVNLFNNLGSTHVVADVAGWFGTDPSGSGGTFVALPPSRILDTRMTGALGAGALALQVTGAGGVPATGVAAVVLNVTVTEPTAGSYLTAWPVGEAMPLASNLNYSPGQTVPNLVIVKVGAGGVVGLFNNAGWTHVVVDVAGWYLA
jgi:hypothetical protein